MLPFLLLTLACSSSQDKEPALGQNTDIETNTTTVDDTPFEPATEPAEEEDTDPQEQEWDIDTDLPACDPALQLQPQESILSPNSVLLFQPTGGTGNYRFSLVTDDDDVSLDASSGFFAAGSVEGEHTITVADTNCTGSASATLRITAGLHVEPLAASMLPETEFSLLIENHSGEHTCELLHNQSQASLQDCTYQAGPDEGIDIIKVTDTQTDESVLATFKVRTDAALELHGERIVVATDSSFQLRPAGGSGYLTAAGFDSQIVSFGNGAFTALSTGSTTATVTDVYTGLQESIRFDVISMLATESTMDGDRYTRSVLLSEGDLNGDGLDDLVMGLARASLSSYQSGLVAIYSGNTNGLSETPLQVLGSYTGQADHFGESVAIADFDQDGLLDLAIGSHQANQGGTQNGAIYLHYNTGSTSMPFNQNPDSVIPGASNYDRMGAALVSCDLNGDGWLDLITGSPLADNPNATNDTSNHGSIDIFYGGANGFPSEADIRRYGVLPTQSGDWVDIENLRTGDTLGSGDFNGDGLCDIATGTETMGFDRSNELGLVAIYLNEAGSLSDYPSRYISRLDTTISSYIGSRLIGADVDADGTDELFVGSWRYDEYAINDGVIAMFQNIDFSISPSQPLYHTEATWLLAGPSSYDLFGVDFELQDWNADGVLDLLVGASAASIPDYTSAAGGFFVISGTDIIDQSISGLLDYELHTFLAIRGGPTNQMRDGQAVTMLNDMDGDGLAELATIAGRDNTHGIQVETIWIHPPASDSYPLSYPGNPSGDMQGNSFAYIDIDGDDVEELLVGAPRIGVEELSANTGRILIYQANGDTFTSTGEFLNIDTSLYSNDDYFGYAMTAESDFDGDGYKDLAVMSREDDTPKLSDFPTLFASTVGTCADINGNGSVMIFRGGPSGVEASPTWVFYPNEAKNIDSFRGGLDHNGDGKDDLILGSMGWGNNYGGVAVIRGQDLPAAIPVAHCDIEPMYGTMSDSDLGRNLASAGDINGDGCDDFLGGLENEDTLLRNIGSLRIFWGWGASGCPAEARVSTLSLPIEFAELGYAMDGGIDVNDDGYPDSIVSSLNYELNTYGEGAVWLLDGAAMAGLASQPLQADGTIPTTDYQDFSSILLGSGVYGTKEDENFGAQIRLFRDAQGVSWVAVALPRADSGGGPLSGAVELYRYDSTAGRLESTPHTVISGTDLDPLSDLGRILHVINKTSHSLLMIGLTDSDYIQPDQGAAMVVRVPSE